MQVVKCNPSSNMFGPNTRANRFFNDFFYPSRGMSVSKNWRWDPKVDIYNDDDKIVSKAELPGVDKDNIVVDVKDRVLTLRGERSSDEKINEDNYYRRERAFGSFERRFTLPDNVDPEKITADYKDGVLEVGIPKPMENKPKQITVH